MKAITADQEFQKLHVPPDVTIVPCPVCGSTPELWQHVHQKTLLAQKVVMCSRDEPFGPQIKDGGAVDIGCLLLMPPEAFYRPRIKEAVDYWNEYAKSLQQMQRRNHWKTAKVLRTKKAKP